MTFRRFATGYLLAALGTLLALSVVVLATGLTLRLTLLDPDYVMSLVRQAEVLPRLKTEFLGGIVEASGLDGADRAALRVALEEGVRVTWLEQQLEQVLRDLAAHLGSVDPDPPPVELDLLSLKVTLAEAIHRHMREELYLEALAALETLPDTVDVGVAVSPALLGRVRPLWRAALLTPPAAAAAAAVLSVTLWLAAGRGRTGAGILAWAWMAAGLFLLGLAAGLGGPAADRLGQAVPVYLPELGTLPLRTLALATARQLLSILAMTGAGAVVIGAMAQVGLARLR